MKNKNMQLIINLLLILIGNLIFAIAINAVVIPNHLGEGGVTGITLFLLYVFGWNNAVASFLINAVLMVIGWKYLDPKTIIYTLLSILSMSLFLQFVHIGTFIPENSLIAPAVAGALIGIAIGIVIRGNGTTGGTDIVALILNKFFGISIARAFLILDILILIPLTFVIGLEKGVMTVGTIIIASKVINYVLEGYNPRKAVTIVSDHHEVIAKQLLEVLDRGITVMNGYGFYTKKEKHVLYIVVNQRQLLPLQKIVHSLDPKAFITVADIHQVVGEGFTYFLDESSESFTEYVVEETGK